MSQPAEHRLPNLQPERVNAEGYDGPKKTLTPRTGVKRGPAVDPGLDPEIAASLRRLAQVVPVEGVPVDTAYVITPGQGKGDPVDITPVYNVNCPECGYRHSGDACMPLLWDGDDS